MPLPTADEGQVLRPSLAANTPGSAAGCEPGSNTPLSGTRVGDPHAWGAERSGNGQPSEKRPRLDPKAAALAKAAEARATKAAEVRAKQAEGTKKISAFFGKR